MPAIEGSRGCAAAFSLQSYDFRIGKTTETVHGSSTLDAFGIFRGGGGVGAGGTRAGGRLERGKLY
jgi:hypothetical protein